MDAPYVKGVHIANMVKQNNIVKNVVQKVSVNTVIGVADVSNVESEALYASIKNSKADVVSVEAENCAIIQDVANTVLSARECLCAYMVNVVDDVTTVMERIAVLIKEIRNGVSSVLEIGFVHMGVSESNALHVAEKGHVNTENERVFVKTVLPHIYVHITSKKISVENAIQNLHVFMIDFVYNVSFVIPKSPANTANTSI